MLTPAGSTQDPLAINGTTGIPLGSSWTASAWYYGLVQNPTTWRTLFKGGSGGVNWEALVGYSGGGTNHMMGADYTTYAASTLNMDNLSTTVWHQVTEVDTAGTIQFYIDGGSMDSRHRREHLSVA